MRQILDIYARIGHNSGLQVTTEELSQRCLVKRNFFELRDLKLVKHSRLNPYGHWNIKMNFYIVRFTKIVTSN